VAVDAGVPVIAVPEGRELAVTTVTEQDRPAEAAVTMLRDLTEAVAAVAGRLFDLPEEDSP
jgi:hypothetical protein